MRKNAPLRALNGQKSHHRGRLSGGLCWSDRAYDSRMPMIDLSDDEPETVAATLRSVIASDRRPRGPRLLPLRAALAKLDPVAVPRPQPDSAGRAHARHRAPLTCPMLAPSPSQAVTRALGAPELHHDAGRGGSTFGVIA